METDKPTLIQRLRAWRTVESIIFPVLLFIVQVVCLVLFWVFVSYATPYDDEKKTGDHGASLPFFYKHYSDIAMMMFIGFGFLMTFLKKYAFGSVALTFLLTCICIEWTILNIGFWKQVVAGFTSNILINLHMMIEGLFGAATILISFGAVIGKMTPSQLLIMTVIEVFLYSLNNYIGYMVLKTSDVGGSMIIHTFGAYFGIFVSAVVSPTAAKHGHPNKVSGYYSDVFSMIGTVFLWVYWPSFNSAPASELNQYQTVANTVCALIGSCVATFFVSRVFRHNGKFEMEDVQNATLAGGVAIGAAADMLVTPAGAMSVGLMAGTVSALGFRYLTPLLEKRLHLHDSCGVNNLHGMTGIMGGITSIIASAIVYQKQTDIMPQGRFQPLFQLATLGHTLGIAILGGLGTGLLLRWLLPAKSYYDDAEFWNMPPDYEILVPEHDDAVDAKKEEVELDDKNITVDVLGDEVDEKIDASVIPSQEVETL